MCSMIPKFLIILGLISSLNAQSCYPNYMIEQVVQSISEMQMTPTRQISYNFQTNVYTSAIEFQLYSKGIEWAMTKIHLWIYNRDQFFSQDFQFTSIKGFTKKYSTETRLILPSFLLAYKETYHIQPIYQAYLTGLQSVSSSSLMIHSVKLTEFVTDDNLLRIQISSDFQNTIFSIRILLVMIPIQTKEFSSYEIDFSYKSFKQSYELLNGRFFPVFNMLLGLKSLAFKTNQLFSLKQEFDMQKALMKISATNGKTLKNQVTFLQLSLISFGRLISQVCAPCNQAFIQLDACRTQCSDSYVSKIYFDANGKKVGKICTKCLPQVNMEYSSDLKACICKKQHTLTDFGTRCNPKQISQIKTINSDSQTKNVFVECEPNSKRDSKTGNCICDIGFQFNNSTKKCQKQVQTSIQSNQAPAKEKLKLSLDTKTPTYLSSGIILDFFITPLIRRTEEQVEEMFSLSFSDEKLAAPEIYISQNDDNIKEYRVYLHYRNNLPYKKFTVTIKIKDKNLGEDFVTLLLDPLNVPATFSRRSNSQSSYLDFRKP